LTLGALIGGWIQMSGSPKTEKASDDCVGAITFGMVHYAGLAIAH